MRLIEQGRSMRMRANSVIPELSPNSGKNGMTSRVRLITFFFSVYLWLIFITLVDTGSEDTFREMLRIKRAVQASFNTETSFIAAQAAAASKGTEKPTDASAQEAHEAADPMAAMERELNTVGVDGARKGGAPAFVASTLNKTNANGIDEGGNEAGEVANPDAIVMDEDEF